MPVTIHPAPHGANVFKASSYTASHTPLEYLKIFVPEHAIKNGHIIQSSFENLEGREVYPAQNGFVDTAILAYNQHHKLVLRPDDVWIAVLSQFSIYVNAHSEELRHLFVDHDGQKHLEIVDLSDIKGTAIFGVDWGKFSFKMSKMLASNIKDPSLREWILPCFSTTTKNDQAVASILMMATLKKFFSYGFSIACGIPEVTLMGRKEDWEVLAEKAERLGTFGEEAERWGGLLRSVLRRFVESFERPEAEETRDFWQRIAHYSGGGSGPSYLSGWITAFTFFQKDGTTLHRPGFNPPSAPSAEMSSMGSPTPVLQLDDARYHRIETGDVPPAWADVPVRLDDDGTIIPCMMVAGLVGMSVRSSSASGEEGARDTLGVESGWWMYETFSEEEAAVLKEERKKVYKERHGYEPWGDY